MKTSPQFEEWWATQPEFSGGDHGPDAHEWAKEYAWDAWRAGMARTADIVMAHKIDATHEGSLFLDYALEAIIKEAEGDPDGS